MEMFKKKVDVLYREKDENKLKLFLILKIQNLYLHINNTIG